MKNLSKFHREHLEQTIRLQYDQGKISAADALTIGRDLGFTFAWCEELRTDELFERGSIDAFYEPKRNYLDMLQATPNLANITPE